MIKILLMPAKEVGDYHIALLERALLNENINVSFPDNIKFARVLPIFRRIKKLRVNILHTHWIHGIAGFVAKNVIFSCIKFLLFCIDIYLVKYLLKTKIVWTVNNLYSHESIYPKFEKFGRTFFAKKVDAIVCHCFKAKDLIQREYRASPERIYVIPMGNYTKYYKNEILKDQARKILNIKSEDFIFLHFGRVKKYKGIDSLIKSFNELERNDKIKLLIVGSLSNEVYGQKLVKLANQNKNIIFKFEYIPDDEIQIYMNASDIVVTPYRNILNSGEIIVAIGFSKPIVAPRLGCIMEMIDEEGSFLYNPQVNQGLKEALKKSLNSRNSLSNMGFYNYNLSNKLDWEKVGKLTKQVYQNL